MALQGGEGSAACPGRSLSPGKTQYPLYRRLGGPQAQSGQVRKISPLPPGFDPRTVQPVASCYNNWAIPIHQTSSELPLKYMFWWRIPSASKQQGPPKHWLTTYKTTHYYNQEEHKLILFMHPQNFSNDCFWPGDISTFKMSTNNYLLLI